MVVGVAGFEPAPPRPERGSPRIRRPSHVIHLLGPARRTTGKCGSHVCRNHRPLHTARQRERASLTDAAVGYDQTSGSHAVDDPRLGGLGTHRERRVPFLCPFLLRCSRFVRVLRDCDIDPKANG